MQSIVAGSTDANERAVIVIGRTLAGAPLDISAVTLRVVVNGGAAANADGTLTRLDSSSVHRFVWDNDAQFAAMAAGDRGVLFVPYSASGDGRDELAFPFLVTAGNPGSAALSAADIIAAEIAAMDGFTSTDTALDINGVAHTITRNDTDGYITAITAD